MTFDPFFGQVFWAFTRRWCFTSRRYGTLRPCGEGCFCWRRVFGFLWIMVNYQGKKSLSFSSDAPGCVYFNFTLFKFPLCSWRLASQSWQFLQKLLPPWFSIGQVRFRKFAGCGRGIFYNLTSWRQKFQTPIGNGAMGQLFGHMVILWSMRWCPHHMTATRKCLLGSLYSKVVW